MAAEQCVSPDWASLTPGPELAAQLEGVAPAAVPDRRIAELLGAYWRQISHLHAGLWAAMAELGRRAPADPAPDDPDAWAVTQIAAALRFTRRRAEDDYRTACQLLARLPLVWRALTDGRLDPPKAKIFLDHLAELTPDQREHISRRLLPGAADWTTGQLAHRLLREVLAIDPGYARRRYHRGREGRGVWGYLAADGTAVLSARGLAPDEAAAAAERLDELAAAVRAAGHPAAEAQLRADLFVRLLDGRYHGLTRAQMIAAMLAEAGGGAPSPPPPTPPEPVAPEGSRVGVEVRVGLTTLLGLDERPGELPGWGPVDHDQARRLVERQHAAEWRFAVLDDDGHLLIGGLLRRRPDGTASDEPAPCAGGVVEIHVRASRLDELSDSEQRSRWAAVIAEIAGRYRNRDADLARIDAAPTARHPSAALRRHVQIRDRTCCAPGCRRPARKADIDHTLDYARGGATVAANTEPLCEWHHRMKHRGGWTLTQVEPGRFCWRAPLGQRYRTGGEPVAPDLPDPLPAPDSPDPPDAPDPPGPD